MAEQVGHDNLATPRQRVFQRPPLCVAGRARMQARHGGTVALVTAVQRGVEEGVGVHGIGAWWIAAWRKFAHHRILGCACICRVSAHGAFVSIVSRRRDVGRAATKNVDLLDHSLVRSFAREYHYVMQLATGTVINGKVVVEGLALPEGTVVTVLTRDDEESVQLSPAEEAELLEALDEADREEGVSAQELLARLQRFG